MVSGTAPGGAGDDGQAMGHRLVEDDARNLRSGVASAKIEAWRIGAAKIVAGQAAGQADPVAKRQLGVQPVQRRGHGRDRSASRR